jgi:hypothetical protein
LKKHARGYIPLFSVPLALSGASPQPASAEIQNLPGTEAARALLTTQEWSAFRSFWRAVEPPEEGTSPDWNLVSARAETLSSLVRDLRQATGDSTISLCTSLLGQLCESRLSMSAYGLPQMMTRMIPSRAVFHEEAALRRLEGRLASLRELSQEPLYNSVEMAGLLGAAVGEATSALLFDAMSDGWLLPHTFTGMNEESLGTAELLSLDLAALDSLTAEAIAASDPSMKEECMAALGRVRSIQASLPALEVLLGDLLSPL